MYALIIVKGGLIEDVHRIKDRQRAINEAVELWKGMEYEEDDLKVFNMEDKSKKVVWQPPIRNEKVFKFKGQTQGGSPK